MPRKKKQVISKEHLEKISTNQSKINDVSLSIGRLESEKHKLLHYLVDLNNAMDDVKKELEAAYGNITVDLATGEYKLNENGTDTKN